MYLLKLAVIIFEYYGAHMDRLVEKVATVMIITILILMRFK